MSTHERGHVSLPLANPRRYCRYREFPLREGGVSANLPSDNFVAQAEKS